MFHAVLFFLYHIKTKEHGMLRYCWFFYYTCNNDNSSENIYEVCILVFGNETECIFSSSAGGSLGDEIRCGIYLLLTAVWCMTCMLNIFCCWRNILAVNLSRAFIFVATLPITDWLFVIGEIWNTINVDSHVRKIRSLWSVVMNVNKSEEDHLAGWSY